MSTTATHGPASVIANLTRALIAEADAAHTGFPQYVNYFDAWVAVDITKRVLVKGRVAAFEPGDVVLARPDSERDEFQGTDFITCWSRRTGWNTSVPTKSIRAIKVDA